MGYISDSHWWRYSLDTLSRNTDGSPRDRSYLHTATHHTAHNHASYWQNGNKWKRRFRAFMVNMNKRQQVMQCIPWNICYVEIYVIVGSDNSLLPGRRQAILWINAGILLIGSLETNFSEILIEIYIFLFRKCIWKCRQKIGSHFVSASMC